MNITWLGIITIVLFLFSIYMGGKKGLVREVVSMFLIVITLTLVSFINPYMTNFLEKNTPIEQMVSKKVENQFDGKIKTESDKKEYSIIEGIPLPDVIKNQIISNNTEQKYKAMAVNGFSQYMTSSISKYIINTISFSLCYFLIKMAINIILYLLNILTSLPVIRGANKIAGAILGAIKFIIFLWLGMLVLSIFISTSYGVEIIKLINQDTILKFFYDNNYLAKLITSLIH